MKQRLIASGNCYHIFNRSIAKYIIFNDEEDFLRFLEILKLYRFIDFNYKYSDFIALEHGHQRRIIEDLKKTSPVLVNIVSYCLMPTHFHLILKQITDNGISNYMSKVANCYSKYFNAKHGRRGPLWERRFSDVLIKDDNQLLHATRYLHLNPTSAGLVKRPEDWAYSSYNEFILKTENKICDFDELLDIKPKNYQKFVEDQIGYQKELSKIKSLLLDNYPG